MASNKKGLIHRFTATTDETNQPQGTTFTEEQWATVCEVFGLDATATPDDLIAAATTLIEESAATAAEADKKVAASQERNRPVFIDSDVWEEMSDAVKLGLKAKNQEKRLQAERIVDQAIRLGKIQVANRERFIVDYQNDPEGTVAKLSNKPNDKVPYFERGHGMPMDDELPAPGWVRN